MLIYCCHKFGGKRENIERAKQLINRLQVNDLQNTYISPIHAFSYLDYEEIGYDEEINLCLDLLRKCEKVIVLSEISEGVQREIKEAQKQSIPIVFKEV